MSAKIPFDLKSNLPRIIWGVVGIALVLCLAKVAVWEHSYYAEKEGSARAVAVNNTIAPEDTSETVDENDISDAEKTAHIVAADRPRYLSIEKLGIVNARIVEVGVSNIGRLQTPTSIFDVGWYRSSGKPGSGGTLLLDGHNGGPTKSGVFKRLPELEYGDIIVIERGDGAVFKYKVVENENVALSEADSKMSVMQTSPIYGTESVSIITCTGVWSVKQQTYLSRQFLRAIRTE